jgi:beta-galactosidase
VSYKFTIGLIYGFPINDYLKNNSYMRNFFRLSLPGASPVTSFKKHSYWPEPLILLLCILLLSSVAGAQQPAGEPKTRNGQATKSFTPGELWYDNTGELINAHGGGILYINKKYYWFGEKRGQRGSEGVNVYSSADLYNWKFEGLALSPNYTDTAHDIAKGCVMERPKVIYNASTRKYIMWFHLELRGKGYSAARAAVAVSDKVTGPYTYVHSFRPNSNMSRDMTLFKDGKDSAYIIYSSRENYDLRIAKLSDDYLTATESDKLLFSKHREAPAILKYKEQYYLITSGCTGWQPNKATVHRSASVWGPWEELPVNPMSGPKAETTFDGQSTYILPVAGKKDYFIFLADKWNPRDLKDSRYLWLPVQFRDDTTVVEWTNEWEIKQFAPK